MLDKWRSFAESAASSAGHVFNCVFLQNPMCETMMRFGFDSSVSEGYIREIYDIILPLEPFVVYLKTDNIAAEIKKALPERGEEWLSGVIDYHCGGEYGKSSGSAALRATYPLLRSVSAGTGYSPASRH